MKKLSFLIALVIVGLAACKQAPKENSSNKTVVQEKQADFMEKLQKKARNQVPFRFGLVEECAKDVSEELLTKYKKKQLFDIVQEATDSTQSIVFSFIDDCCLKFKGRSSLQADTLKLITKLPAGDLEVCECHCVYTHRFDIKTSSIKFSAITLNDSLLVALP